MQHFSQIVPRVCTSVLFIIIIGNIPFNSNISRSSSLKFNSTLEGKCHVLNNHQESVPWPNVIPIFLHEISVSAKLKNVWNEHVAQRNLVDTA